MNSTGKRESLIVTSLAKGSPYQLHPWQGMEGPMIANTAPQRSRIPMEGKGMNDTEDGLNKIMNTVYQIHSIPTNSNSIQNKVEKLKREHFRIVTSQHAWPSLSAFI